MEKDVASVVRPPSLFAPRFITVVAWLWLIVATPFLSDASCNFLVMYSLLGSGCLLGLTWLAYTAKMSYLRRPRAWTWWLAVPLAVSLGAWMLSTDRDLALRVALCEDSLNRCAADARKGELWDVEPKWVGLFHVDRVEEHNGGVYLFTSRDFLNSQGVANIPPGAEIAPRVRLQHLYGTWYKFSWKW